MDEVREVQARWVKGILRAEMAKRGMTYSDLAKCLRSMFIEEDEKNLANKIARGNFSAALFLACLSAMGIRELTFEPLLEYIYPTTEGKIAARTHQEEFLAKLKDDSAPKSALRRKGRQSR
jgi:hypothetical protein